MQFYQLTIAKLDNWLVSSAPVGFKSFAWFPEKPAMPRLACLTLLMSVLVLMLAACGGGGSGGAAGGGPSAAPAPEINVVKSVGSVANGGSDSLGNMRFGTPHYLVYYVHNTGNAPLNLTGTPAAIVSGQANCTASVAIQPVSTIGVSTASSLEMTTTPTAAGAFSFSVTIPNDDADENPFTFTVQGNATLAVPVISTFIGAAEPTTPGHYTVAKISRAHTVAVPLIIRNVGGASLALTGTPSRVAITLAINGSVSVRDQPAANVAPGDATVCMLLATAGGSGTLSASIVINSNDPATSSLAFTLEWPIVAPTSAAYWRSTPDGTEVLAATVPGGAVTLLSPALSGNIGCTRGFHLGDRYLFASDSATSFTDCFFAGLPPAAPATTQNISFPVTMTGGQVDGDSICFAGASDNFAFIGAGNLSGPFQVYSVNVNGSVASAPTLISGSLPAGTPFGVEAIRISPQGTRVAMYGDLATAGVAGLSVVPFGGGARLDVPLNLGSKYLYYHHLRWLPDGERLIFLAYSASTPEERDLYLVDVSTATPSVTKLNGNTAGREGVQSYYHVSDCGTRIIYVSDENAGYLEPFCVSLVGGSPSAAFSLRGTAVPANYSAGVYSCINASGTRLMFTARATPSGKSELFYSEITGTTPTSIKVVSAAAASIDGVAIFPVLVAADSFRFVSDTKAVFIHDDVVGGRGELFYLDVSSTPTVYRLGTAAAFPAGSNGIGWVQPSVDGLHVVFTTDQGAVNSGERGLVVAALSPSLGAQRITPFGQNVNTFSQAGVIFGNTFYYVRSTATIDHVFACDRTTLIERQISGPEVILGVTGLFFFDTGRICYTNWISTSLAEVWTATTGTTPVRNRITAPGDDLDLFDTGLNR